MHVEMVALKAFRNFDELNIELSPGVNIFVGDNAQGKTNFLESLYMCSIGRSWRTHLDKEMIAFKESEAHIRLIVRNGASSDRIDVHLRKDGKKGIALNALPIRKMSQLFGRLLTVIFSPEDLQLIKAGPSERRRFMDMELCQLGNVYYYELQRYYHVLKQRNNLLKSMKIEKGLKETVFVWDEQLISHGAKIISHRYEFIDKINEIANKIHLGLTDNKENLSCIYKPNVLVKDFADKLKKNLDRDIIQGATSVGIHKDDINFLIDGFDARIYGSQGQQRTAALSAKLAEIELIKEQTGNDPVLLLDDVLSELDESRQKYFLNNMSGVQTFITCTGLGKVITSGKIYTVTKGTIRS